MAKNNQGLPSSGWTNELSRQKLWEDYFVVHFHLFNCNRLSFPTLHLLDLPTLSATSSDWWWRILKTLKLQKKNKSKNELKLPKQIMKTSHIHDIEISVAAQHLSDSHLSSMNSKVGRNVSVSGWMMVYPVYPVILEILMFFWETYWISV